DPDHAAQLATPAALVVLWWWRVERRHVRHEWFEALANPLADLAVEAGADLPGKVQLLRLAAAFVVADDECPELARRALTRCPATDDELLLRPDLDLQPGPGAPAGFVDGAAMLGDDAFEALLPRRLEEHQPLADNVIGESHSRVCRAQDRLQELLAALQRDVQ